jgi:digalactosyldiacylglycerol synthase
MAGFGVDTRPAAAAAGEGALSFLSRSLREDLRLIRARAGELETFLSAPVPEPDLFARLRRAYTTTSSSAGSGSTRLDLSAIGKAFEAEVGRGWGAKTGWRWEEEDAGEWEPIRAVKARLRDLDRRRQDYQAADVLHKVKLSLVSCLHTPANASVVEMFTQNQFKFR